MTEEVIKYSTANSTGGRMDAGRKAGQRHRTARPASPENP